MRVVFLGSPPFATPIFERLLGSPRHVVAGLVTRPDRPRGRGLHVQASPLVELARARGIPVLQPERARGAEFVQALRALEPDALLVASFGQILGRDVLELAPRGAFNVHASLLPRHRGASPIQAAILAGDRESGVSLQRMVLELDAGDVVDEIATPIGARETAGELLERLSLLGAELAQRGLDAIEAGTARPRAQDPARVTHARRISKDEGAVDWTRDAPGIERHVRAMTPWPGAVTQAPGDKTLALLAVRALPGHAHASAPGTLLPSPGEPLVACAGGAVALETVRPAGRPPTPGAAWLRGSRLEPGARLG